MQIFNCRGHLLQQPFRCGSGSAHPCGGGSIEPLGLQFFGPSDEICARVDAAAPLVKHLAVGAGTARHEYDHVMLRGKLRQLLVPSRHLCADTVMHGKPLSRSPAQFFFQLEIASRAHGSLGEKFNGRGDIDRSVFNQSIQGLRAFDYKRPAAGSSHEGKHLGVAYLAKK